MGEKHRYIMWFDEALPGLEVFLLLVGFVKRHNERERGHENKAFVLVPPKALGQQLAGH
jgi:hypothetical protein